MMRETHHEIGGGRRDRTAQGQVLSLPLATCYPHRLSGDAQSGEGCTRPLSPIPTHGRYGFVTSRIVRGDKAQRSGGSISASFNRVEKPLRNVGCGTGGGTLLRHVVSSVPTPVTLYSVASLFEAPKRHAHGGLFDFSVKNPRSVVTDVSLEDPISADSLKNVRNRALYGAGRLSTASHFFGSFGGVTNSRRRTVVRDSGRSGKFRDSFNRVLVATAVRFFETGADVHRCLNIVKPFCHIGLLRKCSSQNMRVTEFVGVICAEPHKSWRF